MSSSRCQPRRGASRTWRSKSTSRTEPRPSFQRARAGCKRSEMRRQSWCRNRARHGEAAIQKRPVERLPIEGDKNGTLRDAGGKLVKERILFGKIPHEELFNLKCAGVPPGQTNKKCVGSRCCQPVRSVSVSRKSHLEGSAIRFGRAARDLASRVRERSSRARSEGSENSGVENQLRKTRCSPK